MASSDSIPEWLAYRLNSWWRKGDFYWNRTYDGVWQWLFGVRGYAPATFLLLFPVLWAIINGPTLARFPSQEIFAITVVVFLIAYFGCRYFAVPRTLAVRCRIRLGLLDFQALLIVATCAIVWLRAAEDAREWEGGLYRHAYLAIAAVAAVMTAVVTRLLAISLIHGYRKRYVPEGNSWAKLLNRVELFVNAPPPRFTYLTLCRSALSSPILHISPFFFMAALPLLFVPRNWMTVTLVISTLISAMVVTIAGVHDRAGAMLAVSRRGLFLGTPLLLSWGVIILAALRYFEVLYVSIVLESTRFHVVFVYLAIAYVTLWFYEAWAGHVLCERLFELFREGNGDPALEDPNRPPRENRVRYRYQRAEASEVQQLGEPLPVSVIADDHQYFQIHGGRFAVVGRYPIDATNTGDAWETYDRVDLFQTIARKTYPNLTPVELAMTFGLAELRRRIEFYHLSFHLLILAALVGGFFVFTDPQVPALKVPVDLDQVAAEYGPVDRTAGRTSNFSDRFFVASPSGSKPRNVVLVASSGGGTRAAVYAASVFEGLADVGALDDVVLHSGVSGGSTAIAYLQQHHGELVGKNAAAQWDEFHRVMAAPFIDDVLRGVGEWRILKQARISRLLAESFCRRMTNERVQLLTLGRCPDLVVFNTTMAARGVRTDPNVRAPRLSAQPAGGRLVFTNSAHDPFPAKGDEAAANEALNFVVINDPNVPAPIAAAYSANFPPVFPNAGILAPMRENPQVLEEYWVTDGGAADNRGIEAVLYLLRDALVRNADSPPAKPLPRVHVIVAEASAFSNDFSQDRGVGSAFGASQKFAGQLMTELLADCRQFYVDAKKPDDFQVYYLAMPSIFRTHGGIGTHWMLPATVTLNSPGESEAAVDGFSPSHSDDGPVVISGATAARIIRALHKDSAYDPLLGPNQADPNLRKIGSWLETDQHRKVWADFKRKFSEASGS